MTMLWLPNQEGRHGRSPNHSGRRGFLRSHGAGCGRAADLARRSYAIFGLTHVLGPIVVDPVYDMAEVMPVEVEVERTGQAPTAISRLGRRYGVPVERCWVESGTTITLILDKGVDLIAVGSHGRHGVGLLLGSTANAVLHGARCDVLAVRST